MARKSATERTLRDDVANAKTNAERSDARRRLTTARATIEREKNGAQYQCILEHTRGGGWGKRDMTTTMAHMPYLLGPNGQRTYNSADIGQAATDHYRTLFTTAVEPIDADRDDPHHIDERRTTGLRTMPTSENLRPRQLTGRSMAHSHRHERSSPADRHMILQPAIATGQRQMRRTKRKTTDATTPTPND